MDIGLELNLMISDLDAIQLKYKGDVEKCFTEMLNLWLRTSTRPTLAHLVAALRQPVVGYHHLAKELEANESLPISGKIKPLSLSVRSAIQRPLGTATERIILWSRNLTLRNYFTAVILFAMMVMFGLFIALLLVNPEIRMFLVSA